MPAVPRLNMRQAAYAGRIESGTLPRTREIMSASGPLGRRLRAAIGSELARPGESTVERAGSYTGLRFPGNIVLPESAGGDEGRTRRNEEDIEFARRFESDTRAIWTDGSALPGGVCASAVVAFVEGDDDQDSQRSRVVVERKGMLGRGGRGEGRELMARVSDRLEGSGVERVSGSSRGPLTEQSPVSMLRSRRWSAVLGSASWRPGRETLPISSRTHRRR